MKLFKAQLSTDGTSQSFHVEASTLAYAISLAKLFARQHFGVAISRHSSSRLRLTQVEPSSSAILEAQQVHALLNIPAPISTESTTDSAPKQPNWADFCAMFEEQLAAL